MRTLLKQRLDQITVAFLVLATFATRIPFRSHYLWTWDSGSFALALDRFNVAGDQPQSPGYILYVGLGRFFRLFFHDANDALVALSIVSAAASIAGIYLLGKHIFGRTTGLVAAAILFFSPLGWFYGEIALSYGVELPLAMLVAWLLYEMYFNRRYAVFAAIALALAAGVRQDALMFLGPFWLVGTLRFPRRKMLLSWAALAASVSVWLVPLIYSVGGISEYRSVAKFQFNMDIYPFSVLAIGLKAIRNNGGDLVRGFLGMFGLSLFALLTAVVLMLASRNFRRDRRILFMLILPVLALSYDLLFQFGPPGYLLVYSSTLVLAAAWTLVWIVRNYRPVLLAAAVTAIAVFNVLFFVTKSVCVGPSCQAHNTLADIRASDRESDEINPLIRQYDSNSTLIVSGFPIRGYADNWRRLMYYLPEYTTVRLRIADNAGGFHSGFNHQTHYVPDQKTVIASDGVDSVLLIGIDPEQVDGTPIVITPPSASLPIYRVSFKGADRLHIGDYEIVHQRTADAQSLNISKS